MEVNTVKDISTITTIPEKTLNKFFRKMIYCICDSVAEDMLLEDPEMLKLNIGIGELYIKIVGEEIKYHFEPNDQLQKGVKQTVVNKKNILANVLSDTLAKKFEEVYKDLC